MTRKKTAARLEREIAAALAAGPSVTISVHQIIDDADDYSEEDRYIVSDDGGEYDDSEETSAPEVQGEIDERRWHYRALGRKSMLDVPERGWE